MKETTDSRHRCRAAATVLLLAGLLWAPTSARADLDTADFSDLVEGSDLIARVTVRDVKLKKNGAGHVLLEVEETLHGTAPKGRIRIDYDGEEHDQYMNKKGEKRLVFLKKSDGSWRGTVYGRSYWPLLRVKDKKVLWLATPYMYPTSMIRFTGDYADLLVESKQFRVIANPNESWEGKVEKIVPVSLLKKKLSARAKAGKGKGKAR